MTPRFDYSAVQNGVIAIQPQERIVFGHPAGEAAVAEAERYGARRVFVVSCRSLARLTDGPLQRVVDALGQRCAGVYSRISAHTPREDVVAAAAAARSANADLLVAVGGGSTVDATKAMLLCLWMGVDTPQGLDNFHLNSGTPEEVVLPANPIRMVAVSTTLSASEFTSLAGVTDTRISQKQLFRHPLMVPRSAILDPAATFDTPAWLISSSGMRAVDHAVESYCSLLANPATEGLSLQGLKLLAQSLPLIKAQPENMKARLDAQFGMWQAIAGSADGASTGASHGIGYALGATFDVPHGHTSCVLLPSVMRWNAVVNAERQRALSIAMGAPGTPAADLISDLVKRLEQPQTLRDVNVGRDSLDLIATRALSYPVLKLNPRSVSSAADVREILDMAW